MTNVDDRIAQFERMAAEDPDNDMAHFSLGNAYLQAGTADALAPARRFRMSMEYDCRRR